MDFMAAQRNNSMEIQGYAFVFYEYQWDCPKQEWEGQSATSFRKQICHSALPKSPAW